MLSIVILSSDGYSDCWDPLFTLLEYNFPEIENHELILSSNTKKYVHSGLEILSLTHGKDTPWSKRLQLSLDKAHNEIVLVLVEDFFLFSKMNSKVFNYLLNLILTNVEIDHIRLLYNTNKVKTKISEFEYLDEINQRTKNQFLFLPGLWKKNVLQKYVVGFETPFMAEIMGNYRSWILKDKFFVISKSYLDEFGRLYDCPTSGAIIKGKWGKWLPDRLEENAIKINYTLRGFKDQESNKEGRIKARMNLLKTPILTLRSVLVTFMLFFKR